MTTNTSCAAPWTSCGARARTHGCDGLRLRRIKWLTTVPPITEADVTSVLPLYGFSAWQVEFLAGMYSTTNVSEMSRRMMLSQARGRVRFFELVDRLSEIAKLDEGVRPFADYFEAVRASPSILWEGTGPKKLNRTAISEEQREARRAQILALVRAEVPFKKIAERVGVALQTVYKVARRNGMEPPEVRARASRR